MLRPVAAFDGEPQALLDRACADGWEGLIAKRADSLYRSGRSPDWRKLKCSASQELVVGGWTDPAGSRIGLGALLVGYYDDDGQLQYAGKVGTGFDDKELVELHGRLVAGDDRHLAVLRPGQGEGRPLGTARVGGRRRFHRMDSRWPPPSPAVRRHTDGQGRHRGQARTSSLKSCWRQLMLGRAEESIERDPSPRFRVAPGGAVDVDASGGRWRRGTLLVACRCAAPPRTWSASTIWRRSPGPHPSIRGHIAGRSDQVVEFESQHHRRFGRRPFGSGDWWWS